MLCESLYTLVSGSAGSSFDAKRAELVKTMQKRSSIGGAMIQVSAKPMPKVKSEAVDVAKMEAAFLCLFYI